MFAYIPHELAFLQKLLAYRPEGLNSFFIFLNNFDKASTYYLIGIAIWTFLSQRLGKRCIVLLGLCVMISFSLKTLFGQPRPLMLDPALGLVNSDSYFGLPSGAAQAYSALAIFLMYYFKENWVKITTLSFMLLICISRVYIGMHFISDVMVGLMLGFVVTKYFLQTIELVEINLTKLPIFVRILIPLSAMGLAVCLQFPPAYQMGIGAIVGVLINDAFVRNEPSNQVAFLRKLMAFMLSVFAVKGILLLRSFLGIPLAMNLFLIVNAIALVTWATFTYKDRNLTKSAQAL